MAEASRTAELKEPLRFSPTSNERVSAVGHDEVECSRFGRSSEQLGHVTQAMHKS